MEQTKNSPDQEEESIHSREWSWENREMERWKDVSDGLQGKDQQGLSSRARVIM